MRLTVRRINNIIIDKKELTWYVLYIFLIFPLMKPEGLNVICHPLYVIFKYGSYVSFMGILFAFLCNMALEHIKISRAFIAGMIFLSYMLLLTFLKNGSIKEYIIDYMPFVCVLFLLEVNKKKLDKILLLFLFLLEVLTYVNLMLVIICPNGMYISETTQKSSNWLLGYKSSIQYYVFPAVCLSWINMYYRKQKLRGFVLFTASLAQAVLTQNMMLVGGLFVMLVFYILYKCRIWAAFDAKKLAIIILFLNAGLLLTSEFINIPIVQNVLSILGRDSNLSARNSIIWPKTIAYIQNNPFCGYGIWDSSDRVSMYNGITAAIHAHNQLLEITFSGGLVGLLLFLAINYTFLTNSVRYRYLPSAKILTASYFGIYIMSLVEVFTRAIGVSMWLILALTFYCGEIDAILSKPKKVYMIKRFMAANKDFSIAGEVLS